MFWDSFRPYGSDLELAPRYFEKQIPKYIENGIAYQADTLDDLAQKIGCDASTFKATVQRDNDMCEAGEDTDYYKKPVFFYPREGRAVLCDQSGSGTACHPGRVEDERRLSMPRCGRKGHRRSLCAR